MAENKGNQREDTEQLDVYLARLFGSRAVEFSRNCKEERIYTKEALQKLSKDDLKSLNFKLGDIAIITEDAKEDSLGRVKNLARLIEQKYNSKKPGQGKDTPKKDRWSDRQKTKLHVSWLHKTSDKYVQVRMCDGGGHRELEVDTHSATVESILSGMQKIFFPGGESPRGKLSEVDVYFGDFKRNKITQFETLEGEQCSLNTYMKCNGIYPSRAIFYFLTESKLQNEKECISQESEKGEPECILQKPERGESRCIEKGEAEKVLYVEIESNYSPIKSEHSENRESEPEFAPQITSPYAASACAFDNNEISSSPIIQQSVFEPKLTDKDRTATELQSSAFDFDSKRTASVVRNEFGLDEKRVKRTVQPLKPVLSFEDQTLQTNYQKCIETSFSGEVAFKTKFHGRRSCYNYCKEDGLFVGDFVEFQPALYGFAVVDVLLNDNFILRDGSKTGQLTESLIAVHPTEFWGYEEGCLILGTISSKHLDDNTVYAWFKNGIEFVSGPCCISVTTAGKYSCIVQNKKDIQISNLVEVETRSPPA